MRARPSRWSHRIERLLHHLPIDSSKLGNRTVRFHQLLRCHHSSHHLVHIDDCIVRSKLYSGHVFGGKGEKEKHSELKEELCRYEYGAVQPSVCLAYIIGYQYTEYTKNQMLTKSIHYGQGDSFQTENVCSVNGCAVLSPNEKERKREREKRMREFSKGFTSFHSTASIQH